MIRARTTGVWAAIVTPTRGQPWVMFHTIRGTRRDAKRAYLDNYLPQNHARMLEGIRFARVTITEDDHA